MQLQNSFDAMLYKKLFALQFVIEDASAKYRCPAYNTIMPGIFHKECNDHPSYAIS